VPVLLHDDTVDRTTGGSGNVHEMTLADVRGLDAGARQFAPHFLGQRIPTLAEVIDLTRGKALLQIEVKQKRIEEAVAAVVRDASALADCEVHSFFPSVVRRIRELEPRMACAFLTGGGRLDDWSEFCGFALSINAQAVSVYYPIVTPERVHQAQRRALTCMVWTVDDEPDIRAMLAAGVDSINTNHPDRARRLVDEYGAGR
jgi:glycerophosphoryl diester phosphodiesterase